MSGRRVLFRFGVTTVVVMVCGLTVMMSRRLVLRSGGVVMVARRVLGSHSSSPESGLAARSIRAAGT
jgi:hypothetical protein